MSGDRELLEKAAKAAGIVLSTYDAENIPSAGSDARIWPQYADDRPPTVLFYSDSRDHPMCRRLSKPGNVEWNPLTDDGDALRLAVKLKFNVCHYGDCVAAGPWAERRDQQEWTGITGADPYAATRRAIVRAAAEIGEKSCA